jgi:hypothetical protein
MSKGFARSSARWNIVAQQLLIAQLEHDAGLVGRSRRRAWSAARLSSLGDCGFQNVVAGEASVPAGAALKGPRYIGLKTALSLRATSI